MCGIPTCTIRQSHFEASISPSIAPQGARFTEIYLTWNCYFSALSRLTVVLEQCRDYDEWRPVAGIPGIDCLHISYGFPGFYSVDDASELCFKPRSPAPGQRCAVDVHIICTRLRDNMLYLKSYSASHLFDAGFRKGGNEDTRKAWN